MILGECPHDDCKHFEMRPLPDASLPAFSKEVCEGCGRTVWVYYSRIDPKVYTEEDFLEDFEVDEDDKSVHPKGTKQ